MFWNKPVKINNPVNYHICSLCGGNHYEMNCYNHIGLHNNLDLLSLCMEAPLEMYKYWPGDTIKYQTYSEKDLLQIELNTLKNEEKLEKVRLKEKEEILKLKEEIAEIKARLGK
jgi:hypothetical protein